MALAQPAAAQAHGGIRIDGPTTISQDAALCTFGQACETPVTLDYSYTLPDGTSSNLLYVYAQGVIGLGSAVHVEDGKIVSTGAYLAPGFDLSLNPYVQEQTMFTPDSVALNFYVGDAATGGVFQVLFTDGRDPLIGEEEMLIHFGAGGYGSFEGLGISRTAFIGSAASLPDGSTTSIVDLNTGLGSLPICGDYVACGDAPAFDDGSGHFSAGAGNDGVPEPATWAVLLTGFALMGAALRRRRPALA